MKAPAENRFWYLFLGILLGAFLGAGLIARVFELQNKTGTAPFSTSLRLENPVSIPESATAIRPGNVAGTQRLPQLSANGRDQRVAAVKLPLQIINGPGKSAATPLEAMLGKQPHGDPVVYVEYWRSPLNYTGYRFSGRGLIIYGLDERGTQKIFYQNGTYFLRHNNLDYKLQYGPGFHPFQAVEALPSHQAMPVYDHPFP